MTKSWMRLSLNGLIKITYGNLKYKTQFEEVTYEKQIQFVVSNFKIFYFDNCIQVYYLIYFLTIYGGFFYFHIRKILLNLLTKPDAVSNNIVFSEAIEASSKHSFILSSFLDISCFRNT